MQTRFSYSSDQPERRTEHAKIFRKGKLHAALVGDDAEEANDSISGSKRRQGRSSTKDNRKSAYM